MSSTRQPWDQLRSEQEWRLFLEAWGHALLDDEVLRKRFSAEVRTSGWLGYQGASTEEIEQAERRLGTKLPPSYRTFLRVTNGWRDTCFYIRRIWSTSQIEWFSVRNQGWIDAWVEAGQREQYRAPVADVMRVKAALEVSEVGDDSIYLLSPFRIQPDGEWEAWCLSNWAPDNEVYPSFRELMLAEYERYQQAKA